MNELEMIECPKCHGKTKEVCADCHGTGKSKCTCGNGKVNCPVCDHGTIRKTRWINCSECHGEGVIYDPYDKINHRRKCVACHGRGQVEETYSDICPNCHGDYRNIKTCPICEGSKVVVCGKCKGTGEVKVRCDVCNGKGEIRNYDIDELCLEIVDCSQFRGDLYKFTHCTETERVACSIRSVTREMVGPLQFASDNGNGNAAFAVAMIYDNGITFDDGTLLHKSEGRAEHYYEMAAENGNSFAQCVFAHRNFATRKKHVILGYRYDEEMRELNEEARNWLEKSAAQGNLKGLVELAISYTWESYKNKDNLRKAIGCCDRILACHDRQKWDKVLFDFAESHKGFFSRILHDDLSVIANEMHKWWRNGQDNPRLFHIGHGIPGGHWEVELDTDSRLTGQKWENDKGAAKRTRNVLKNLLMRRHRWMFILIGLFFGWIGLQFVYAGRWKFLFAHWLSIIVGGTVFPVFFIVPLVLWIGSIFFMKRDGEGYRM